MTAADLPDPIREWLDRHCTWQGLLLMVDTKATLLTYDAVRAALDLEPLGSLNRAATDYDRGYVRGRNASLEAVRRAIATALGVEL